MDGFWIAYIAAGAFAFAASAAIFRPRSAMDCAWIAVFSALWPIPAAMMVVAAFNGAALMLRPHRSRIAR